MTVLSNACRSASRTLRVPLIGSLSVKPRFTSSKAGSSSEVAPAGQSVKDLTGIPEEAKDLVTAEAISGAPGMQAF